MASDTEIHHRELLITLDYLLRFTDENHPASQTKICEYAKEFGIKYDSTKKSGNEIKRQRISNALYFLKRFSDEFVMPFAIEQTDKGKYSKF